MEGKPFEDLQAIIAQIVSPLNLLHSRDITCHKCSIHMYTPSTFQHMWTDVALGEFSLTGIHYL